MRIYGMNDNPENHLNVWLVLFDDDFPSDELQLCELNEDNIVAECFSWDELEKWLSEHPASEDEYLHLSIAVNPYEFANPGLYEPFDEFASVFEIQDIRNVELSDDFKKKIERDVYDAVVYYEQVWRGIGGEKGKIERIRIVKLFHKYDVDIDLSKPINVLIGANGIGKTTIIKLLDNYYNKNYIDVLAAPFEKIEYVYIEDAQDIFELQEGGLIRDSFAYNDFFPTKEAVINSFKDQYSTLVSTSVASFTRKESDEEKIQRISGLFENMIDELAGEELYGPFLYCFYKEKPFTKRISRIVEKWFEPSFIHQFKLVDRCDLLNGIEIFDHSTIEDRFVEDRERIIGDELSPSENAVYYIDFVQPISLANEIASDSNHYKGNLDWIASKNNLEFNTNQDGLVSLFLPGQGKQQFEHEFIFGSQGFRGTPLYEARPHYSPYAVGNRELYKSILCEEYNEENTFSRAIYLKKGFAYDMSLLDEMISNRVFRINELIHQNYYKNAFVLEINNMSIDRIKAYFDSVDKGYGDRTFNDLVDEYYSLIDRFANDFLSDYIEYVHPVLVRNSFYCLNIKKLLNLIKAKPYERIRSEEDYEGTKKTKEALYREVAYLMSLCDYLQAVIPLLKDNSNKTAEIITYENVIKKYLAGKYISITPSGITIRDSVTNRSENKTMVLYDADELDLSIVSSGEKKILVLFALQIFYSECMFLLDEPELSLSILWQETLVPDLMSSGKNKFVIATHSPYIAKDESVREFIKYLPQSEV